MARCQDQASRDGFERNRQWAASQAMMHGYLPDVAFVQYCMYIGYSRYEVDVMALSPT